MRNARHVLVQARSLEQPPKYVVRVVDADQLRTIKDSFLCLHRAVRVQVTGKSLNTHAPRVAVPALNVDHVK